MAVTWPSVADTEAMRQKFAPLGVVGRRLQCLHAAFQRAVLADQQFDGVQAVSFR